MKKLFYILTIIFVLISCKNETEAPKPHLRADAKWATTTFKLEGMHCTSCAAGLQKKLFNLEGVKTSKVDFESKSAEIIFDKNVMSPEKIVEKALSVDDKYVVSDIQTADN